MSIKPVGSTFISSLDKVLRGGLTAGEIYEIYGKSCSGKSNLCMYLSAKIGSIGHQVVYIDTKNSFLANRVFTYCGTQQEGMEKIYVLKRYNFAEVNDALKRVLDNSLVGIDMTKTSMLIIDSVPMIFYPSIQSNEDWGKNANIIYYAMERICKKYSTVCIAINHVTTDRSGFEKPAMGRTWERLVKNRIKMSVINVNDGVCLVDLEKSVAETNGKSAQIQLTESGFQSVE